MANNRITEEEANKPVRFIFHNNERPGKKHAFLKNSQLVTVFDGKEYIMPEHIVRQLENNRMVDYKIEGDVDEGPTATRTDRPRFFIERLPMKEKKEDAAAEDRSDVLADLNKPKTKAEKKAAAKAEKKAAAKKEEEPEVIDDEPLPEVDQEEPKEEIPEVKEDELDGTV